MSQNLPEPGDVIGGKYTVDRVLGRGGMGTVYVVSHRVTGKRLALKCLLPEHLDDDDLVQRFLREAQAAGRIQHRHVVDVFDVGQDGSLLYMVMPLLEGKPLSTLLREDQLTLEETLGILVRAMEGVGAAHAQGIIHRDLKPDNIFVCVGPSGRFDDPRVLDFGISKRDDEIQGRLTRSGVMMGTPYYMSFEQINSQRDLDQRVDVYAMGVILYEALAGMLPHSAESIGQLAIRMMGTPPAHLSTLRPDLPPGLADVVMRAIARDRDDRFPSMHAFAEAVRPYLAVHHGRSSLLPDGVGTPLRGVRSSMPIQPNRGEDATVPMRSPVPQPLRVTSTGTPRLRHRTADHTPPRIITPSGSGLWIGLLAVALVGAGTWFWLQQPSAPAQVVEKAPAPVAVPKEQPAAAPVEPPVEPAVEPNPDDPAALEERASDAERPTKKQRKKRRVVRTTTEGGQQKSIVLFIEDDAGVDEAAAPEAPGAAPTASPDGAKPEVPGNDQKAQPAETPTSSTGSDGADRPGATGESSP